jgi:glycerate-2-kinase
MYQSLASMSSNSNVKSALVQRPKSLVSAWAYALRQVSAPVVIHQKGEIYGLEKDSALLFWGKAARATAQVFPNHEPRLIIGPENSDHPLPGERSFSMGGRLLDFFDYLGRTERRRLAIFLSGGASSLAWIRHSSMSERVLRRKLHALYRRPLTIQELNQERAKLCGLKAGGAARWLKRLAPRVRARVYAFSDVEPFGVETIGSGPFTGLPHQVLAGNSSLVNRLKILLQREGILEIRYSQMGTDIRWARILSRKIHKAVSSGERGVIIWGGEPQVKLPTKRGKGGRQCQIAARLLLEHFKSIATGRVEILCGSSDGSDGNSGAAAVYLYKNALHALHKDAKSSAPLQRQLEKAISSYNTAPLLRRLGLLISSDSMGSTGTNVQDIILVRIR